MIVTASALPRLFKCIASGVLPKLDVASKDADAGNQRHREMADAIIGKEFHKLPDEVRELVAGLDVDAEVAMGYDVASGRARVIGYNIGRAYGEPGPFEVVGSTDLIAVGNGRLVVLDWKGHMSVGAPADNEQLMFYALAASRIYNIETVELVVAHIADSNSNIYKATVDAFDLDAFAASLRELFARAASAKPEDAIEGPHCHNCNSAEHCPRRQALALDLAAPTTETRIAYLDLNDDEVAADAYEFAGRVRMLLRRLDTRLYARAGERPFAIADGKMFGKVVKAGNRELDGRKVFDIIKELHGIEVANKAVTMEATQKSIEEALKTAVPRGAGKGAKDKVMTELEKSGGVTRRPKVTIEEFDAPTLKAGGV
jgi:hypothetical protein